MKTTLAEVCAKLSKASKNLWNAYATHDFKKVITPSQSEGLDGYEQSQRLPVKLKYYSKTLNNSIFINLLPIKLLLLADVCLDAFLIVANC